MDFQQVRDAINTDGTGISGGKRLFEWRHEASMTKYASASKKTKAKLTFVACADACYKIGRFHAQHPDELPFQKAMNLLIGIWMAAARAELKNRSSAFFLKAIAQISSHN